MGHLCCVQCKSFSPENQYFRRMFRQKCLFSCCIFRNRFWIRWMSPSFCRQTSPRLTDLHNCMLLIKPCMNSLPALVPLQSHIVRYYLTIWYLPLMGVEHLSNAILLWNHRVLVSSSSNDTLENAFLQCDKPSSKACHVLLSFLSVCVIIVLLYLGLWLFGVEYWSLVQFQKL